MTTGFADNLGTHCQTTLSQNPARQAFETNVTTSFPKFNLLRQKLGAKGMATRQKILDSVVRLVNAQTREVPSISLICRAAFVSESSFYQHFEDFTILVTELLQRAAKDIDNLAAMIADDWKADELYICGVQILSADRLAADVPWSGSVAAVGLRRIKQLVDLEMDREGRILQFLTKSVLSYLLPSKAAGTELATGLIPVASISTKSG